MIQKNFAVIHCNIDELSSLSPSRQAVRSKDTIAHTVDITRIGKIHHSIIEPLIFLYIAEGRFGRRGQIAINVGKNGANFCAADVRIGLKGPIGITVDIAVLTRDLV